MKILIITDAWHPQVNGVVRTYEHLTAELKAIGHDVHVIGPSDFPYRFPMPGYKEIELALFPYRRLVKMIENINPHAIHIGTEGPLGWAARKYCKKTGKKFSTFYHTQFPDYAASRFAKTGSAAYRWWHKHGINYVRKFHAPSGAIMVTTTSIENQLKSWHFRSQTYLIPLCANLDQFTPGDKTALPDLTRPIALYVGRVAIEKNLEDFLKMDWDGTKVIVGDGPERKVLSQRYPQAQFLGKKTGTELANIYRSADLFVFPSRTDTFGIVILEALASGTPVAAYNAPGARDIITKDFLGALHDTDLSIAAKAALADGTSDKRSAYVKQKYSWARSAKEFEHMLEDTANLRTE